MGMARDSMSVAKCKKVMMRVSYKDGAYHNFPALEKNTDGVYFIQAMGFSL